MAGWVELLGGQDGSDGATGATGPTGPTGPTGTTGGKVRNLCKAYLNSAQDNITDNTITKVTLDATVFDTGSDFDTTTDYEYTCPENGKYIIAWTLQLDGLLAGQQLFSYIYISGTAKAYGMSNTGLQDVISSSGAVVMNLSSSDTIDLRVKHNRLNNDPDMITGEDATFLCIAQLY